MPVLPVAADDKVQHALQEVENATGVHTVVIPMRCVDAASVISATMRHVHVPQSSCASIPAPCPRSEPEDRTVRDIWYEALSQADSH